MENLEEVVTKKRRTDSVESTDYTLGSGIAIEDKAIETSFEGLPDDIHIKFLTFLDLPSRLKLRVNKRLDKLERSVRNNLEEIEVLISEDGYELLMETSLCRYRHRYYGFNNLDTLRRLFLNSCVDNVWICVGDVLNEENVKLVDVLCNFKADVLTLGGAQRRLDPSNLPLISLSILLKLSENVRNVKINFASMSISVKDLCTLRQIMLEGDCKMKEFEMPMREEMINCFIEECFGVTVEEEFEPLHTKIYRTENESVELFGLSNDFHPFLTHFEDDLQTTVDSRFIYFKKRQDRHSA